MADTETGTGEVDSPDRWHIEPYDPDLDQPPDDVAADGDTDGEEES